MIAKDEQICSAKCGAFVSPHPRKCAAFSIHLMRSRIAISANPAAASSTLAPFLALGAPHRRCAVAP